MTFLSWMLFSFIVGAVDFGDILRKTRLDHWPLAPLQLWLVCGFDFLSLHFRNIFDSIIGGAMKIYKIQKLYSITSLTMIIGHC